MKHKIIPILSILVGILAFFLSYRYLQARLAELARKEKELYEGARAIRVAAAAHDLPGGTTIKSGDVGALKVFKRSVGEQVVTPDQVEMIYGKKTLFTIKAKEPILWSYIEGGTPAGLGLAPIVKPGMRAISLSVGGAAAVTCMVEPNDRIDVLGTFSFPSQTVPGEMETVTLTVLQDVTVLATGRKLAKQALSDREDRRSRGYNTVTLEVTPREAELLVFAQQMKGRLTLSLRNPNDVSFEKNLPVINFEHLENKLPELNLYRQQNIRHKRKL